MIRYEIVNINMKKRPEWYSDISPAGLVPALQHDDGRVVLESTIICEYLVFFKLKLFLLAKKNIQSNKIEDQKLQEKKEQS